MKFHFYSLLIPPLMISKQLFFASLKGVGPLLQLPRTWAASVDVSLVIWHQGRLAEYVHCKALHPINVLRWYLPPFPVLQRITTGGRKINPNESVFRFFSGMFLLLFFQFWFLLCSLVFWWAQTPEWTELQGCPLWCILKSPLWKRARKHWGTKK